MSPDDPTTATAPVLPEVPLLELRDGLPDVVETSPDLARVVERFAGGSGPVAVDAERASGYRYSQRAYVVQLRRQGAGTALLDPVPFGPVPNQLLQPLTESVGDTEWVIHAASQDLACLAELGLRPARLFDTELAGRLLNYPRVGLASMVQEKLGYRMRKEHSAVDWSIRPLRESWLLYAALDVEPLLELRDILAAELVERGRDEWARQEFAAWAARAEAPPRFEPWRRTTGIQRVRGRRALGVLRAMWERRDEVARQRDLAPGRIVSDEALVQAACAGRVTRGEMRQLAGFRTRGGQRHLKAFHEALSDALALPDDQLPTLSPQSDAPPPSRGWADRNPAAASRLRLCREALKVLAAEYDLPAENLLQPEVVRRLAWTPPTRATVPAVTAELAAWGARPWQVELTAPALAAALTEAPAGSAAPDVPSAGDEP